MQRRTPLNPIGQVDVRYCEKPYYVVPRDAVGQESFAVIRDAMSRENVAALARVVLPAAGIDYLFLGLELGGRPKGDCIPDYELMAASPLFAEGIAHVEEIAPRTRLALMCSEHEPLTCHRCLLVGRRLVERGVEVAHILRDGTVEPNEDTEDRLLALTRRTERDLFAPRADRIAAAYRTQGLKITGARR